MTQPNGPETVVGATRVEALYYRSLRYVSQPLGPFHVLVGPNASGKSNFLDVLALLGDAQKADLSTAVLGDHRWNIPMRATDGRDLIWLSPRDGWIGQWRTSFELAVLLTQAMARAAEMGPLDEHLLEHPFAPNPRAGQRRP